MEDADKIFQSELPPSPSIHQGEHLLAFGVVDRVAVAHGETRNELMHANLSSVAKVGQDIRPDLESKLQDRPSAVG
eukprot:COSAG05_NODE_4923_length_1325_cov_1.707178_2_plen_76_part_00